MLCTSLTVPLFACFIYTSNQAVRLLSNVFYTLIVLFWKSAAKLLQSKTRASAAASFQGNTIEEVEQEAAKEVEKWGDGKLKRAEVRAMRKMRKRGTGGTKRLVDQRAREQPTAKAIAATWQELMSNFRGFDVNGDVDDQIQQYCKIRSDRYKRAVVGGLKPFIKGNDYAFFEDVLETLGPKKRRRVIKHILLRFNKDSLAVLNDNQVQKELSTRAMQMSKADAILLFYAGNYSEVQWDGMASAINKLMDDSTRRQFGCIIPCARTLNRHLEHIGAKLKNEDISVVDLLEEEDDVDIMLDLTICDDDGEDSVQGAVDVAQAEDNKQPHRAAFVKDVMGRLVVPELKTIRKYLPETYQKMVEAGAVDIVLAIDNHSRHNFGGHSKKLEQAVIKIVLPDIDSAQQSNALAIPIFFMDGDETYASLQKVLTALLNESLKKQVQVPMQDGEGMKSLLVNWHLCSDHKLVALFGGFGGASCNKPCFLCDWDRTAPCKDATLRSVEVIQQKSEWAQEFFRPIHKAQAKLKLAKQVVQLAKKSRVGVKPADQAKLDRATHERLQAFQHVGKQLQENPDHALVQHLCDAQRLQRRAATLPKKHMRAAEAEFEGLRGDLQAAHDRVARAEGKLQRETANLLQLEEERSQFNEEMDAEEELEILVERIDLAQESVDAAEESVTGERDAWDAAADQANAIDGVLVRIEPEAGQAVVKLYHPNLYFSGMSMTLLQSLLVEACEGIYRSAMVQDFLPPDKWYIESLHLIINTGNGWLEVARNTFQYLLQPDGTVRDRKLFPSDTWPLASSGSRQKKGWREAGFDFEEHMVSVLGTSMRKPLTKYHGAQIEMAFKRRDEVFAAEPLASGMAALQQDPEVRELVQELRRVFAALSEVHKQVSIPKPSMSTMRKASHEFASSVKIFEFEGTPQPCRYRLKFYDHAVIDHILDMSKLLQKQGLSLAIVSSKFLEANNKVVKAVMRRLPGGGQRRDGSFAHLPLVQGLKRCIAASHARRQELYKAFAEQKDACLVD